MERHGGDIYTAKEFLKTEKWVDFSANINPFGVPHSVQCAIEGAVQNLVHYPDPYCRELRTALAQHHRVPFEQIVCGNGGADIIFRMVHAVSPHRALVPVPTFSEYGEALESYGCTVDYWKMPFPFVLTEALMEEMCSKDYDFLVLCNPNNPTGSLIKPKRLCSILDLAKQKQMTVLLDECFYDMTGEEAEMHSMIQKIGRYPNLFLLKSMTKLYAIPGLRLGYGICADEKLVEQVRTTGQPWPVSVLAGAAGCAALRDAAYRQRFLMFLKQERQYLYNGLCRLGFRVWEPHANYVFFQAKGYHDLDRQLLKDHILLRHCENYRGLNAAYYRAAVRTHEENQYFLQCLKKVIVERGSVLWLQNQ